MKLTDSQFFEDIEAALHFLPAHYTKTYDCFNAVFQRLLNGNIASASIVLAGTFAKTDYLLKENKAPKLLVRAINDTRVRLRKRAVLTEAQMKDYCMHDLKHLCQFVAFIYRTEVPGKLQALFPEEEKIQHTSVALGDCMRVIVDHWDEDFVYGQSESDINGEPVKIRYTGSNAGESDWSSLRGCFYKEAQLNIVRPRKQEEVIYPELIIFEPDYLVDISTIARCFTNYADSPLVSLINKMQPAQNSEAILLGNLAGQLLDESIHQQTAVRPYAESVKDFFHENAFNLLTAQVGKSFHDNAKIQRQNITQAIRQDLPKSIRAFDPKEGMVEPNFFCEMLGLQGRMDYLQLDFKVLLEQKAGKGEYPYDNFVTPRQKTEHYVQLLLYTTLIRYNYHAIYEKNRGINAFLLYSKYTQSLLLMPYTAPELIHEAFRIRNGIAWQEMMLTRPDGFRILETLTPDMLNEKHVGNTLWKNYQQPQLAGFLNTIRQASRLERDYYFRFLTFIANEHVRSKLGNKTKESSGFAAKWHDSLEEKRSAGNIYDQLELISPTPLTKGKIEVVTLRFTADTDNDMSNFRKGDIVILYPYQPGQEPDVRKTMVFRGTIQKITADTISLKLRATQADGRVFCKHQGELWAIEHDFFESSYSPLYRAMQAFLTAPKSRRDLLLLQREPETDTTRSLNGDYGNFNELALRVKQARDFFIIIGPPGTGKTSFGLLYTLKEELLNPGSNVLLTAYTNRAVDEICSKLIKEQLDFIRLGSENGCADIYRPKLLKEQVGKCRNLTELKKIINNVRIVVGTTTALNASINLFQLKTFSLAVIDEASQILEPHIIGLLCARQNGLPAIRKFVMIGDHKQLPAVVQQPEETSRVREASLNGIHLTDCRLSLFERLLKQYSGNQQVVYMLTRQGRMHHDIADFPNRVFYNGKLKEVPLAFQQEILPQEIVSTDPIGQMLATKRISFLAVSTPKDSSSDKVNQAEADLIATIVRKIYEKERERFDPDETVGIIVPYRNQIAAIRNTLDNTGIPLLHDITIDTVERYQGSERRYIIYGFTVQRVYQLQFLTDNVFRDIDGCMVDRKLNVAMTRAKEHLILVGNPALLSKDAIFRRLIEYTRTRQCYYP